MPLFLKNERGEKKFKREKIKVGGPLENRRFLTRTSNPKGGVNQPTGGEWFGE